MLSWQRFGIVLAISTFSVARRCINTAVCWIPPITKLRLLRRRIRRRHPDHVTFDFPLTFKYNRHNGSLISPVTTPLDRAVRQLPCENFVILEITSQGYVASVDMCVFHLSFEVLFVCHLRIIFLSWFPGTLIRVDKNRTLSFAYT